jgi:hypothetical protein
MLRRVQFAALAAAALAAVCCHAGVLTSGGYVIAGGGSKPVNNGNFTLTGTIGQPVAARGVLTNNFDFNSGFWSAFDPGFEWPNWVGPAYPPPLGVGFTTAGTNISRSGGTIWNLTNAPLAGTTAVYWGATNNGVELSFEGPSSAGIMQYAPAQSDLALGIVVWTGQAYLPGYYESGTAQTRCTMIVNRPLVDAVSVGLPGNMGGVLPVTSATMGWQAQIYMEANLYGGWVPALNLYDQAGVSGGGSAFSSFAAGFYYQNKLPVISPITNIIMAPGTSYGPVPFTLSDPEFPVAALTLSSNSDNSLVLPNNAIQITGSGGNYNMTLTTTFNFLGVAHVTLTAVDPNGGSNSEIISVYSDTPPTISNIGNQQVAENGTVGPIGFTVGDNETAAGSLSLSAQTTNIALAPVGNITFGGSGANRTVTVQPNTGVFGTSLISVIVSDGILTATNSFLLTVVGQSPQFTTSSVNGLGQVVLQFNSAHSSHNTLLGTTNLATPIPSWLVLGVATETSFGVFQFTDTNLLGSKDRFYLVRSP